MVQSCKSSLKIHLGYILYERTDEGTGGLLELLSQLRTYFAKVVPKSLLVDSFPAAILEPLVVILNFAVLKAVLCCRR